MNKARLEERVQRLQNILASVADLLDRFSMPEFDEDYKVERHDYLTEDAFDMVEQFANELADRAERHLERPTLRPTQPRQA